MTDWDVKRAFQNYTYPFFFPLIYIDDYWDHYLNLFGLEETYEIFKDSFKKEFNSFAEFKTAYIDTIYAASKKMFNTKQSEVLNVLKESVNTLTPLKAKYNHVFNMPDGKYLQIDLHKACDQVIKNLGVFNTDYESTTDVIKSVTKSKLLPTLKPIRIFCYQVGFFDRINESFLNCADILNKVYNSNDSLIQKLNKKYELTVAAGDMYMYNIGNDDLTDLVGDYEIDGISLSMSLYEIKTINILGQENKVKICTSSNEINYVIGYTEIGHIIPEVYPLAVSLYKGLEPTEKDLAIGYEDKIFFHLNKNDYEL